MSNGSAAYTGPASSASTSWKTVAAVRVSPAITARWTGAAPRYAGRSEKCRLTQPRRGSVEGGTTEERTVRDDDAEVGLQVDELRGHGLVHPGRLDDGQTELPGDLRHGRRREDTLPALGCRGSGEDGRDLVVGGGETSEGGDGRSGAAGDDETHGVHRPTPDGVRRARDVDDRERTASRLGNVRTMSDVTTSTNRYAGSSIQKVALVVGIVFLLVGIAGFVPGLTSGDLGGAGHHSMAMLLGIFQVSVLHNIVHLLFGVVGLLAANRATARGCTS